jgi:hypothetical protein
LVLSLEVAKERQSAREPARALVPSRRFLPRAQAFVFALRRPLRYSISRIAQEHIHSILLEVICVSLVLG